MNQFAPTTSKNRWQSFFSRSYSLWKFSRPHTIIGTSLSVLALYLIANGNFENALKWKNLWEFLIAWIACLGGNVYIVGLNQLEDIEIDKINKPHLPVAAGEFSQKQAQWIVTLTGILALFVAAFFGKWLLATVSISLAIGTAYSLPPIRLKRFPFFAALCIFTVRGIVVNLGLFLHFNKVLQNRETIAPSAWVLTLFILVFTIAIAIFKDVPDMEGDKQYNITTFTLILGKKAVFSLSRAIITACYLGMILVGLTKIPNINANFTIVSQAILLGLLWWRSLKVDLSDKSAVARFYQFIWKLFFWEYLLFPVACLWQ
jgi:homogentisate phytyltransferase / homogentisate geranylgeranyltransferase